MTPESQVRKIMTPRQRLREVLTQVGDKKNSKNSQTQGRNADRKSGYDVSSNGRESFVTGVCIQQSVRSQEIGIRVSYYW